MARRFLYIVAGLIMLTLAAALGWNLFQDQWMRAAFVPSIKFTPPQDRSVPDYGQSSAWVSRPGLRQDPSRWLPAGVSRPAEAPNVAVFFVAPTTSLRKDRWNAGITESESNTRLDLFVASQASAFNGVGQVWAPRYRQATIGAFLTANADAIAARDFAYRDVERAFDAFLAAIPATQPIILAGHSQGSLHLMRLMQSRVAGKPLARRIIAAYLVGWPISIEADLPALGLPGCDGPDQTGCILSWQSFADPANPRLIMEVYDNSRGLTGKPLKGTAILCTNPLTGRPQDQAPASANKGSLIPQAGLSGATLAAGLVPARCDKTGLLLIGSPPSGFGAYVLPGNNYHVFDYALFWANIRADAERRTATFAPR